MEAIASQSPRTRITSMDVLRGFALLGILLMNIQSFSMVGQAYLNPTAFGSFTGLNQWVWIFSHLIADQKFMSIFSMMFGASIIMITEGAERKNQSPSRIHYTRNFWLLVIGLIHAYVIWYGDILAPYAVCSFLVYPFRKISTTKQFILGIVLFAINSFGEIFKGISLTHLSATEMKYLMGGWQPTIESVNQEVSAYLGNLEHQFLQRFRTALMMHRTYFPSHYLWSVSGLMLMGMSIFKSGFLSGQLTNNFYRKVLFCSGLPGALLVTIGIIFNFNANWSMEYAMFFGSQFNYWGSLGMAFAYISVIILMCKNGWFKGLTSRFAAIGRTALSNYLFQSLICTTLFYGFGFSLFGQVERVGQLVIVFGIWLLQLYISPIWVRYFQYGIMEWIWRSLTYSKIQRIRK